MTPSTFVCNGDLNNFTSISYSATNTWVYAACSLTYSTINLLIHDLSSGLPYKTTTQTYGYSTPNDGVINTVNFNILYSNSPGIIFLAKDFKLWNFGMDKTVFFMNKNK